MRKAVVIASTALLLGCLSPLLLLHEPFALGFLQWATAVFTDYRLVLKNPSLDLLAGAASADEVHLYPVDRDSQALVSVLDFRGHASISELLRRSLGDGDLEASAVLLYVSGGSEASNPRPIDWLQHLRWLPRSLSIGSVHLITQRDEVFIFPLRGLRGERTGPGRFRATSEAQYEGEPLSIGMDLELVRQGADAARFNIAADVYAPRSDSRISFAGGLRGTQSAFDYDVSLEVDYSDISYLLEGFAQAPDLSGRLTVRGRAQGDQRGFRLSDASLVLDNLPDYGLRASGAIDYGFNGDTSLTLNASAQIDRLAYLVDWTGLDLDYFGSAQGNMTITGPLQALRVDPLILVADRDDGARAVLSGRLSLAGPGGPDGRWCGCGCGCGYGCGYRCGCGCGHGNGRG